MRYEDARFVRGEARYVGDLKLDGMLHAAFVRSPYPHARLASIDASGALARDGVHAVLTAADARDLGEFPLSVRSGEEVERVMHPALASGEVRYVGQPIALVVAESAELAADAAELVWAELEELPLDEPQVLLRWRHTSGDVDAAFARADRVVRSHVVAPRLVAAPIEARSLLASSDGDVLTLWLSAQDQHRQLTGLTAVLRMPPEQLHVIVPDVGGAFGSKGVPQAETVALALAALRLQRPVKWSESRTESTLATYQGRGQRVETELAVTRDGDILALRAHVHGDLGAYLYTTTPVAPMTCAMLLPGCYDIPVIDVSVTGTRSHRVPTGPYRGAGRPEAALAIETAVDTAARELGIDPVAFRRRNLVREFPHENGLGFTYDSGDYEGALDAALELAAGMEADGVGVALYVERCGPGYETGAVLLEDDGRVVCLTGSSPHGQGHETTFAQIVAGELGVDPASVEVRFGDSFEIPDGMGTFGSRSVAAGGSALLLAARELKAGGGRRADVRFELPGPLFSFGAYVAGVNVDRVTGEVEIVRVVGVDDCGRVINEQLAEGQVVGAIAQGVGECLHEYTGYDADGQPLAVNLYDYHLPTAQAVPPVVTALRETPSPLNPLGAKGVGEGGSIGTPAAVANAVAAALGFHVELPFTPARIWKALVQGR
ncbi:MAG TPA: xanthine dehydrogenase family protein molybdopterin-binding subunit [Gaiellaceae bacterium]